MAEERIYRNKKYCTRGGLFAVGAWMVVYLAPGIVLGLFVSDWAGLAWMVFGGMFLVAFEWKCVFGKRVVAGRDGFQVVGRRTELDLSYDKIHEARFLPDNRRWRRALGPLLLLEPLWPFQPAGAGMKLVIMHAREPLELRSDEYEGLEEFGETLRRRNVPGLANEAKRPQRDNGANPGSKYSP